MIPKIVHYCWFGGNPIPKDAQKCVASWRRYLPDYEIKEWNESNFDINSNQYVREAYEQRKFAFVTDYVRLYVLYHEGGIYMDTDVEVLKSYDPFLKHIAFSGFENNNYIPTGMMASEKGGVWVADLLKDYDNRHFVKEDGSLDTTTNTFLITQTTLKYGLVLNNSFQDIKGVVTLYPSDYFCPKDHTDGLIKLTDNSVCIHHFAGSWLPKDVQFRHRIKTITANIFGKKFAGFISRLIN